MRPALRRTVALSTAAALALPLFAPVAAQAQTVWSEEIVEQRWERRVERRADRHYAPPLRHAPAPVAPRHRGFDDDGAAVAIGIVGAIALGALAGNLIARQPEPIYAAPRAPAPRPLPPRHRADPDIIPFQPTEGYGARWGGDAYADVSGRYDPYGPRCQLVVSRVIDSWGRVIMTEERVCR